MTINSLVFQVEKMLPDKELCGRFSADLTDMLEACRWFVEKFGSNDGLSLDRDQLESLLIDMEVNMLDHLAYHLDSLRKDFPIILEAVGQTDLD